MTMTVASSRHVDADSVITDINTKRDKLGFSISALHSQYHEQLGRGYLFEIKLDEMLSAGQDVNVEEAKRFLEGIQFKLKYLPEGIQEKLGKLAAVPSVYAALTQKAPTTNAPRPNWM